MVQGLKFCKKIAIEHQIAEKGISLQRFSTITQKHTAMKKLFQFACVAAIAAGFAACGNSAATSENADSTAVVEMSETVVVDSVAVDTAACDTVACDSAAVVK